MSLPAFIIIIVVIIMSLTMASTPDACAPMDWLSTKDTNPTTHVTVISDRWSLWMKPSNWWLEEEEEEEEEEKGEEGRVM